MCLRERDNEVVVQERDSGVWSSAERREERGENDRERVKRGVKEERERGSREFAGRLERGSSYLAIHHIPATPLQICCPILISRGSVYLHEIQDLELRREQYNSSFFNRHSPAYSPNVESMVYLITG